MHVLTWWLVFLAVILAVHIVQGVENVDKKINTTDGTQQGEDEDASARNAIPDFRHRKRGPRHRRHHVLSRHDRRALRHRYNSALAIGVGLGVAGGWICIATMVYVVRYMKAKAVEKRSLEGANLL